MNVSDSAILFDMAFLSTSVTFDTGRGGLFAVFWLILSLTLSFRILAFLVLLNIFGLISFRSNRVTSASIHVSELHRTNLVVPLEVALRCILFLWQIEPAIIL